MTPEHTGERRECASGAFHLLPSAEKTRPGQGKCAEAAHAAQKLRGLFFKIEKNS